MNILVKNSSEEIFVDNLVHAECYICEKECTSEGKIISCKLNPDREIRYGKLINKEYSFFLCADRTFAKTTSFFKEKLGILINTIFSMEKLCKEIQTKEQERYERIVHNLRTLNAKSVQEQFSLISQDKLSGNHENQLDIVIREIEKDTKKAAITFLRLMKNNADIRTEFTAHEKLSVENPNLAYSNHNIRRVILNVYHSFHSDFKERKISMEIFESEKKINIDYETVRLAFYHIFNNAIKYMRTNTKLHIFCIERTDAFIISFKMNSIHILPNEKEKIFEDHYSGEKAIAMNKQGKGLGMGLIRKALELNNATIEVLPDSQVIKKQKAEYSYNQFIITFNLPSFT